MLIKLSKYIINITAEVNNTDKPGMERKMNDKSGVELKIDSSAANFLSIVTS
jgi:hypothetical protein